MSITPKATLDIELPWQAAANTAQAAASASGAFAHTVAVSVLDSMIHGIASFKQY
jgi:hypothetical protein